MNFARADEMVESHPGMSLEPMYLEAVLDYNAHKPDLSLKTLNHVLKLKPDYLDALQLKALILKAKGDKVETRDTYEKLLKISKGEKAAAYHFELAVMDYNDKKTAAAKTHFEEAEKYKFNLGATEFFLGLIAYGNGDLSSAARHFNAVNDTDADELKIAAHFYLGLIAFSNGDSAGGTHEMIKARNRAEGLPKSSLSKDILKAVAKVLAPYNKAAWFGNVALLGGYNTNPSSNSFVPQAGASTPTPEMSLMGGAGWMSSPLHRIQTVISAQASGNLNFNSLAAQYDFDSITLDMYFTLDPLAVTSYGLKLETTFTLESQGGAGVSPFPTFPFSLAGEFGPFVSTDLGNKASLKWEIYFKPHTFDLTSNAPLGGYTGLDGLTRLTYHKDTPSSYWSPTIALTLEDNFTQEGTFHYLGPTIAFTDTVHLPWDITLSPSVTYYLWLYASNAPVRIDNDLSLALNATKKLTPKLGVLASAAYTINYSNADYAKQYGYNQFVAMGGVSYNF